jgi:hypothetical protein
MMQYNISIIKKKLSLKNSPLIQLWSANAKGWLKLPIGVLNLVWFHLIWGNNALSYVEKNKFINNGISKYVEL